MNTALKFEGFNSYITLTTDSATVRNLASEFRKRITDGTRFTWHKRRNYKLIIGYLFGAKIWLAQISTASKFRTIATCVYFKA